MLPKSAKVRKNTGSQGRKNIISPIFMEKKEKSGKFGNFWLKI
jgi:hypothetical protein